MTLDSTHQHGPEGGDHTCTFCGAGYRCVQVHQPGLGNVLPGGRCCPECKILNMKALDRLGVERKAMYQ